MKVIHNKKSYILDAKRAIELGVLKPERPPLPLQAGDVYQPVKGTCCNQLLVRVSYGEDKWQLMGMGCSTNSNGFFWQVHTLAEIKAELEKDDMVFVRNINKEVHNLVQYREEDK